MFRFFDANKNIFFFVGVSVCVLIIAFSLTPLTAFGFARNGLSRIASPLQRGTAGLMGWFSSISNSSELAEINRKLLLENESLRLENSRLSLQVEETEMLYALLGMQNRYMNLPSAGVRVIGRDPNFATSSFHIDKGHESGIMENMAVFAGGGLVGVVRQAQYGRSVVVSVLDSRFAAAAMCARTGDFGVVRGEVALMADNLIRMDHISLDSEIEPGDKIVTSYYSSIFPQGLRIGTVESIFLSRDGLSKYAIVSPSADVYDIGMALVITENFAND